MKRAYISGLLTGAAIAVAVIGGVAASRATDTPAAAKEAPSPDGFRIRTGVVADGEQVPIPLDADTGTIQIFLSIREIQDNNEILGRLECFVESDGRTAHVRNMNKFTGEVVAVGTANYVVFYRQ